MKMDENKEPYDFETETFTKSKDPKDPPPLSSGERLGIEVQSKDGTNVLMALCDIVGADTKELLDICGKLSKMITEHIKLTKEREYARSHVPKEGQKPKGISPVKVKLLKTTRERSALFDFNQIPRGVRRRK